MNSLSKMSNLEQFMLHIHTSKGVHQCVCNSLLSEEMFHRSSCLRLPEFLTLLLTQQNCSCLIRFSFLTFISRYHFQFKTTTAPQLEAFNQESRPCMCSVKYLKTEYDVCFANICLWGENNSSFHCGKKWNFNVIIFRLKIGIYIQIYLFI